MKKALFVPGYHPTRVWTDFEFDNLRQQTLIRDVRLVAPSVPWGEHTIGTYTSLVDELSDNSGDDIRTIVGHSIGTIVALRLASRRPIDQLLLCSPSALYSDDIDTYNSGELLEIFTPEQVDAFASMDTATAVALVGDGETKTSVIYGELERQANPGVYRKAHQLADLIPNTRLIEIAGAGHSIRSHNYAQAVGQLLSAGELV